MKFEELLLPAVYTTQMNTLVAISSSKYISVSHPPVSSPSPNLEPGSAGGVNICAGLQTAGTVKKNRLVSAACVGGQRQPFLRKHSTD